jgi:phosphocarrier protein HPr
MDRIVVIQNTLGLHARPAMQFVDVANGFKASVRVCKGDQCVDGKSIMQMMMLAATEGTRLTLQVDGEDGPALLDALEKLVNEKFGEE